MIDEGYYPYRYDDDHWYEGVGLVAVTFALVFLLVAVVWSAVSRWNTDVFLPVPDSVVGVGENRLLQEQYCLMTGAAQGVPFEVVLQECGL